MAKQRRIRDALDSKRHQLTGARDGVHIHDLALLPLSECREFFDDLEARPSVAAAVEPVLVDVRARLRYLTEVGLGYLTLDRQSRTLSGGEVQRINLTTALGTQLVNTLFVLDEPNSNLDHEGGEALNQAIRSMKQEGKSALIMAHRPAAIQECDMLLMMDDGQRVAYGPRDEVLKKVTQNHTQLIQGGKQ